MKGAVSMKQKFGVDQQIHVSCWGNALPLVDGHVTVSLHLLIIQDSARIIQCLFIGGSN